MTPGIAFVSPRFIHPSEGTTAIQTSGNFSRDGVAPYELFVEALVKNAIAQSSRPPAHASTTPIVTSLKQSHDVSPLSLPPRHPGAISLVARGALPKPPVLESGTHRRSSIDSCKSEELSRSVSGHFDSFPMGSITAAAVTSNGFLLLSTRTSETLDIDKLSDRTDISVGHPSLSIKIPMDPRPTRLLVGAGHSIFASYPDGTILAFNIKGSEIFRNRIEGLSSMICSDRFLFAGSSAGIVEVFEIDRSSNWNHHSSVDVTSSLKSAVTSLTYRNERLFCGTDKPMIVCVNLQTNKKSLLNLNDTTSPSEQGVTHLLLAEDLLVSVAGNKVFFWNETTEKLKYTLPSDLTFSAIAYRNGEFYLATNNNQIIFISKNDVDIGRERVRTMDLPKRDTPETSPIIVNPYKNILSMRTTVFIDPTTKERVNKLVIVGNNAVGFLTIN